MPSEFSRSPKLLKGALVVFSSQKHGPSIVEDMSGEANIVEIDRLLLTGVDRCHPGRLSTRIEVQIRRALRGSDLWTSTRLVDNETSVAGEVARTVVRSIQGGSDGV
jgi:hypothetical protein